MDIHIIEEEWHNLLKKQSPSLFHFESSLEELCKYFEVLSMEGLGKFNKGEIIAAGVLLSYLKLTQCGTMPLLSALQSETDSKILEIDYFTQKSLEILTNLSGEPEGSLISCIDETKTAGGSRLLKQRLIEPFFQINQIQDRHDLANWFLQSNSNIEEYQSLFDNIPDFERSLSRLSLLRGTPKDLSFINLLNFSKSFFFRNFLELSKINFLSFSILFAIKSSESKEGLIIDLFSKILKPRIKAK